MKQFSFAGFGKRPWELLQNRAKLLFYAKNLQWKAGIASEKLN
jgi:hypothetical protein